MNPVRVRSGQRGRRRWIEPPRCPYCREGIAPDVFVPCTSRDLQTGEPTLHKALALLREQLKKGGE